MGQKLRLSTAQPNLLTPSHPSYSWFYQLMLRGLHTTKLGGRTWKVEPSMDSNIRISVVNNRRTERLAERLLAEGM